MGKLSHKLIDLEFFSALGTNGYFNGRRDETHVKRGQPNTCDYNNGVQVVYDEEGRPWILQGSKVTDAVVAELRAYNLKHGAFVPHSNDGGRFVHEIMTKL